MDQILINILNSNMLIAASFGILGGAVRSFLDFFKVSAVKRKSFGFQTRGVFFYFLTLILIGAFMGIVLDYGWALSVLGGYAGSDLLAFVYKYVDKLKIKSK